MTSAPPIVVNVQIAVPRGTPAAERVFELADRLHALAVDDADGERVSTTVAVLSDEPDELVLLVDRREVLLDGVPVHLTRLEYDLLRFFTDNAGLVFTRGQLLRQVWRYPVASGGRTVDVHVRRLRAKLGDRGPVITTVRGFGYRMDRTDRVTVVRNQAAEVTP